MSEQTRPELLTPDSQQALLPVNPSGADKPLQPLPPQPPQLAAQQTSFDWIPGVPLSQTSPVSGSSLRGTKGMGTDNSRLWWVFSFRR